MLKCSMYMGRCLYPELPYCFRKIGYLKPGTTGSIVASSHVGEARGRLREDNLASRGV